MRIAILCLMSMALCAGAVDYDARKVVAGIAAKCRDAKWWRVEGSLEVAGQRGTAPGQMLAKGKFVAMRGPEGRFRLELTPLGKDAYVLVSNGQKSWAHVPRLKSYTEVESAAAEGDEDDDDSDAERDLAEAFVRTLIPALGHMTDGIEAIEIGNTTKVRVEGRKDEWPWLRVVSKKDETGGSRLMEFAFDPASLTVGRMTLAEIRFREKEKTVIRMNAEFERFRVGEPIPDSEFVFDPPNKSKLVDTLPIPGQTGSALLGKAAPDFELKTLDGNKIRLSELRGKPVLLSFWASWCGPCRRELPGLEKIHAELQYKGLVVLGVNDEGRGTAKKFATAQGLTFDTLDDAGRKAHSLYRVRAIPSVFVIDRDGKIVKFFRGAQSEETLRAAVASVGVSGVKAASARIPARPVHTYSIVARDAATGEIGVAVQSHWFSVGSVVPWAEAGVGAVATQALAEASYGPLGLELMRAGRSAPEALRGLLAADEGREVRQVAMIDAQGRVAAHTGSKAIEAAGHVVGEEFSVQANMMLNDRIWPAMAKAYRASKGDLAERMLAALDAAQAVGGDIRGRQSAALIVVKAKGSGRPWADRVFDLRVDDAAEPLRELRRLVTLQRAYNHMNEGDAATEVKDNDRALREYSAAAALAPDNIEMVYWHAVALVNMGRVEESLPLFRKVFAADANWVELTRRLPRSGLLPEGAAARIVAGAR